MISYSDEDRVFTRDRSDDLGKRRRINFDGDSRRESRDSARDYQTLAGVV